MEMAHFDIGDVLRKELGHRAQKSVRPVIGNPLIMKEMVKHVSDAASYRKLDEARRSEARSNERSRRTSSGAGAIASSRASRATSLRELRFSVAGY